MAAIFKQYLKELRTAPLIGPGLNNKYPLPVRRLLHFLFISFRYVGFYLLFKPIAWLILNSTAKIKVEGIENLPAADQGGLATGNHLSMLDPLLPAMLGPRPSYSMVKAEYFNTFLLGGIVNLLGGFPVRRGEADRGAIRTAQTIARSGGLMAIYPEGTRSKNFQLHEGMPGAALVASASDIEIFPMAIWGSENIMRNGNGFLFRRPELGFKLGKPYHLKQAATEIASRHNLAPAGKRGKHDDLEFLRDVMMWKIAELLPPAYRGVYPSEEVLIERHAARLQAIKQS